MLDHEKTAKAQEFYGLTFTAPYGGSVQLISTGETTVRLDYSVDGGSTWRSFFDGPAGDTESQLVKLAEGESVCIRAYDKNPTFSTETAILNFSFSNFVNVTGNVNSLLAKAAATVTSVPDYAFCNLFSGTSMGSVPELPAVHVGAHAYEAMFANCSLTAAPDLPATTVGLSGYKGMFRDCTSLIVVPQVFAATTLGPACCLEMFAGCTVISLGKIPQATSMADSCFERMYSGCSSLHEIPAFPSDIRCADSCFSHMFLDCTSLTEIPGGTFSFSELASNACFSMFRNCTALESAYLGDLPMLHQGCIAEMFNGCSSLSSVHLSLPDWDLDSMANWLSGTAPTGTVHTVTFTPPPENDLIMPKGWTHVCEGGSPAYDPNPLMLTSVAPEGGQSVIGITNANASINQYLVYSYDGGTTWWRTAGTSQTLTIPSGTSVIFLSPYPESSPARAGSFRFVITDGAVEASGSVLSLIRPNHAQDKTLLGDTEFSGLFRGCTSLTQAPALPATSLSVGCYESMFSGCTALTQAPALPATALNDACYQGMFDGCTALTQAPALPATTLSAYCYAGMFRGCTSLTQAPALPATILSTNCYDSMFGGCTSLVHAPELPATALDAACYINMFSGCTALTQAPALPATTLPPTCYYFMFSGCTALTQAPALPATALNDACYQGMFDGCTALTQAPALPATTLSAYCYAGMFRGCTAIAKAPVLPATDLDRYCYLEMFRGCTSLTQAPALPATTLSDGCYFGMFKDCTSLAKAPVLPATELAYQCYEAMFAGCTVLNYIAAAFTDWHSDIGATRDWVKDVQTLSGQFHHRLGLPIEYGPSRIPGTGAGVASHAVRASASGWDPVADFCDLFYDYGTPEYDACVDCDASGGASSRYCCEKTGGCWDGSACHSDDQYACEECNSGYWCTDHCQGGPCIECQGEICGGTCYTSAEDICRYCRGGEWCGGVCRTTDEDKCVHCQNGTWNTASGLCECNEPDVWCHDWCCKTDEDKCERCDPLGRRWCGGDCRTTDQDKCEYCEGSQWCDGGCQVTDQDKCEHCEGGQWCNGGCRKTDEDKCVHCLGGEWCDGACRTTDEDKCKHCEGGQWCNWGCRKTDEDKCVHCLGGRWCGGACRTTDQDKCEHCWNGRWCGGACQGTNEDKCVHCEGGQWCDGGCQVTDQDKCEHCEGGEWCGGACRTTEAAKCESCLGGRLCGGVCRVTAEDKCAYCEGGQWCNGGCQVTEQDKCENCQGGRWCGGACRTTDQDKCVHCEGGEWCGGACRVTDQDKCEHCDSKCWVNGACKAVGDACTTDEGFSGTVQSDCTCEHVCGPDTPAGKGCENGGRQTDDCECECPVTASSGAGYCGEKGEPDPESQTCGCRCRSQYAGTWPDCHCPDETKRDNCECVDQFCDIVGTWDDDQCSCACGLDGRAEPDSAGHCVCKETDEKRNCTGKNKSWDGTNCRCTCSGARKDACTASDSQGTWNDTDCTCDCGDREYDEATGKCKCDPSTDAAKQKCDESTYGNWDPVNCECACPAGHDTACINSGKGTGIFDYETCTCMCGDQWTLDESSNTCVCDTSKTCTYNDDPDSHYASSATGDCICQCAHGDGNTPCPASGDESKFDGFFNSSCECHCTYEGQRCRAGALGLELDPNGNGEVTKTCGCRCIKAGSKCNVATQEDDPNGDGVRGDDCTCRCAEEGEACDWDVAGNPIKWKDRACNCVCREGNPCKVQPDSTFGGITDADCHCNCAYGGQACDVASQTLDASGLGTVVSSSCRCVCGALGEECSPVKDHEDVGFPPGVKGGKYDRDCLCQCDPGKKGVRCTKEDWDYFGSLQEDCDCKCSKDDDTICDYNGGIDNGKVKDCKCICNKTVGTECNPNRSGREGRKNWSSDCLCGDCVASGSITINVGGTDVSCGDWDANCMCSCAAGQDCHIEGTPDGSKTGKTTKECGCTCDKDNLPTGKCTPKGSTEENGEWGDDCDCHCKYTDENGVEHKEGDYCQFYNGEEFVPGRVDKACECQCDVEVGGSCTITKGDKVEFGHWSKDCKCEPCDNKGKDDCGVTDPRQYWNETLCECRCLPAELSKPCTGEDEGKIRDPKTCECTECDREALARRCWGDAKENYDTCDCYCDEQALGPCPEGQHHMADKGCTCGCDDDGASCGGPFDPDHYWSEKECKCKCTKSVDEVCGDKAGHVKDEDCSCECNPAPAGCTSPTFWWDTANCECKCMQDDSGCEDGKTRNPKKNCECECDDSVFQKCDSNPLLMRDPDGRCKCACDVNAYRSTHGGKDPCEYYGYEVGKVTDDCGCECKCTDGAEACAAAHCDVTLDGGATRQVWDAATCSCKCNSEPCKITDAEGHTVQFPRDPKTCACNCPEELADQCNKETQDFDPDKCSCYCKAGHTESDCKAKGKNFQFSPNDCTCICPNTMEGYCKDQGRELNTETCECERCKRTCPEDGDTTKPDLDKEYCKCYCDVQTRQKDCESDPKKSFNAVTCSCEDKKCDNEPSAEEKAQRALERCQVWDNVDCDWVDDSSGWRLAQQNYLKEIADKQRKLIGEITCHDMSREPFILSEEFVEEHCSSLSGSRAQVVGDYESAKAAFDAELSAYNAYVSSLADAASTVRSMRCPNTDFPVIGTYSAASYNSACRDKLSSRTNVNTFYDTCILMAYG